MRRRLLLILLVTAGAFAATVAVSSAVSGPAQWSPDPVAFGSVQTGDSPTQTVTITNAGDSDMTIGAAGVTIDPGSADPAAFGLSNDGGAGQVLNPSGGATTSCTVDVTFTPGSAGDYSAQLDLAS